MAGLFPSLPMIDSVTPGRHLIRMRLRPQAGRKIEG